VSEHSPTPWKIVRHPTPYATWLMDATGGCVALAFGYRDEALLLAAPRLLSLCERAADALGEGALADEMRAVIGVVRGKNDVPRQHEGVGFEPTGL
jgi:hypothetical protein